MRVLGIFILLAIAAPIAIAQTDQGRETDQQSIGTTVNRECLDGTDIFGRPCEERINPRDQGAAPGTNEPAGGGSVTGGSVTGSGSGTGASGSPDDASGASGGMGGSASPMGGGATGGSATGGGL